MAAFLANEINYTEGNITVPTARVQIMFPLKLLASEDTLLRTHCCGHIVAETNVSPFARARNICCGHKFCVRDTKNISDFGQKHFVCATNVSQFAQHGNTSLKLKLLKHRRFLTSVWL